MSTPLPDRLCKLAARGDLAAVTAHLEDDPDLVRAISGGHHRTLLWEAAFAGRLEMVRFLIGRGAPIDTPGRHRSKTFVLISPYCAARANGHDDVAQALLAGGATRDPFTLAYLGDLDDLRDSLGRSPDLLRQVRTEDGIWATTLLHYAVSGEQLETTRELIERGAEVREHSGLLLDIACRRGHSGLVELLVAAGADPATTDIYGVLCSDSPAIIDACFAAGLDPNRFATNTRWPALVYVCRGDKGEHPERVRILVRHGADIDIRGPKGFTALHAAAKAGFCRTIETLVELGADVCAADERGETPADVAERHRRTEAAALLRDLEQRGG